MRPSLVAAALAAGLSSAALATPTTLTFSGTIIDPGVFSTLPVGTPWTLEVALTQETGTPIADGLRYPAAATFSAPGYEATHTSAALDILTISGGNISVRMDGPGSAFAPLRFVGSQNTAVPVELTLTMINTSDVPVLLDPAIPAAIDASDFEFTQVLLRVPLTISPVGLVDAVTVTAACPADLAEPFGVLNFFDVSTFLTAYNAQDAAADLAAPFGVWNFFDVSTFLAAFNAGCP